MKLTENKLQELVRDIIRIKECVAVVESCLIQYEEGEEKGEDVKVKYLAALRIIENRVETSQMIMCGRWG